MLVFAKGVGAGLFGFQRSETVDAWIPLFLFAVLFGWLPELQAESLGAEAVTEPSSGWQSSRPQ